MLQDTLYLLGYRPEDDSWETDGRRTYIHDESATNAVMKILDGVLIRLGWRKHPARLRTYCHWKTSELVEIEPGGDASGHYLHHMKPEIVE
jgi:hypothetical protein